MNTTYLIFHQYKMIIGYLKSFAAKMADAHTHAYSILPPHAHNKLINYHRGI